MRILIAEDDTTSRSLLEGILNKWGYTVIVTCDGNEAYETLSEPGAPKIAILDWMMPGMHGVEVCRRLRQNKNAKPVYLILLTTRDTKKDLITGLEVGADDYITKPFDKDELLARIGVGRRIIELQTNLADKVRELKEALSHIKTLQGILPMCMYCHRIRDEKDVWQRLEKYIVEHTYAMPSHGLCPECRKKHYPRYTTQKKGKKVN